MVFVFRQKWHTYASVPSELIVHVQNSKLHSPDKFSAASILHNNHTPSELINWYEGKVYGA
jgi:hypothetical protein